jgi:hypothetical protein
MAIEGIYRYSDLITYIPTGEFYLNNGTLIPHYSDARQLRLEAPSSSTKYAIYINELYSGEVISDLNNNVEFSKKLPLGEIEIRLVNTSTGRSYSTYLTSRSYATWLSSYAQALEDIDDQIQRVSDSLRIEFVQSTEIEEIYGNPLGIFRDFGVDLESYRNVVHETRLSFRNFGSRYKGLEEVIGEFTQVTPFGYTRRKWGPNWVLGSSLLKNHRFLNRSHSIYFQSGWTDPSIDGVTLVKAEPDLNPFTTPHILEYTAATNKLRWRPDSGMTSIEVDATDGEMFLPGNIIRTAYLHSLSGTFNISSAGADTDNDHLYLNIDDKGIIDITLTSGAAVTPATLVSDINTALIADPRYGATYSSAAFVYNTNYVVIDSPSFLQSTIEISHGVHNAAGVVFGCDPGDLTFNPNQIDGSTIKNIWGSSFSNIDSSPTNYCNLRIDTTVSTPTVEWSSPNGTYGSAVSITEDGFYTVTDSLGNFLTIYIFLDELPTSVVTTQQFTLGYHRRLSDVVTTKGIWVNVDEANLPTVDQAAFVNVYDDSVDGYPETPDNWYLENSSPSPSTSFDVSDVDMFKNDLYDPTPSFKYAVADAGVSSIDLICKGEQFPLRSDLPRGSQYPQRSSGHLYDYAGFEMKFCGWVHNTSGVSCTATLSISFDGGDNWYSSTPQALTTDLPIQYGKPDYVEFTTIIPNEISISSTNWVDSAILGKITIDSASILNFSVSDFDMSVKYITSRSLANATVVRERHHQYYGELIWTRSYDFERKGIFRGLS